MKNSKDFSHKLAHFISDKNLSKTMGIEARRKCENEYNTEKHMKNVLRILGEN